LQKFASIHEPKQFLLENYSEIRDCAIITWNGRGGTGENHNSREGLDVKLNTYRGGGITFFTLFHKLEKW